MDGDKKKVIKDGINKIVKKAEGITGLPTDFRLETSEGTFIFDEKTGEFVKPNSQWMADNPRRWMADNLSKETQGIEGVGMGVIATPDGVEVYSQKFEDGKLIEEEKDIFHGKGMIESSDSSGEKITEITGEEVQEGDKQLKDGKETFTQHHQILPKK